MRVAVIGGSGRMGEWFSRYFSKRGYSVVISDPEEKRGKEVAKRLGAKFMLKNQEAAKEADLALVSVPISSTASVVEEVFRKMKTGGTLCEISSVKEKSYSKLLSLPEKNLTLLCLHPLFGPGRKEFRGLRMAFIAVRDRDKELSEAKRFFPDFEFVEVGIEEHDKMMALVLSLTHFTNIAFLMTALEEELGKVSRLSGSTFALQKVVSTSVLHDSPELSASIQLENQNTLRYIDKFMANVSRVKSIIERGDLKSYRSLYAELKAKVGTEEETEKVYQKANEFLSELT